MEPHPLKPGKLFRSKHKRTYSEERLYHGATLPDDDFAARRGVPLPAMTADTAGPLPGKPRLACGGWGTMSRVCQLPGVAAQPLRVDGFGVAAADGRKRAARGGVSEDAFTAVADLLSCYDAGASADGGGGGGGGSGGGAAAAAAVPAATAVGGSAGGSGAQASFALQGGSRVFHVFGAYDGHRSNHAARALAGELNALVAAELRAPGVLRRVGGAATEAAAAQDAQEEEDAVADALSRALLAVDAGVCERRWVSIARDNGKKFYAFGEIEVPWSFDMARWDISEQEHEWRQSLADACMEHALREGLVAPDDARGLAEWAQAHQQRWHMFPKELYPGAAACAVLVDEARGKVFCANTGDSEAILFSGGAGGAKAVPPPPPLHPPPSAAVAAPSSSLWESQHLSITHKPTMLPELRRIWSTAEGFVEVHGVRVLPHNVEQVARDVAVAQSMGRKGNYRINRDILMSRAVGDADLRQFGVIPTPDVTVTALPSGPSFLVVATDGVWDVISPEDCCAMMEEALAERQAAPPQEDGEPEGGTTAIAGGAAERTAELIVDAACAVEKNNDDVTAVVVSFGARR